MQPPLFQGSIIRWREVKERVTSREKLLLGQIEAEGTEDVEESDSEGDDGDFSDNDFNNNNKAASMDSNIDISGPLIPFEIDKMINLGSPRLLGIFVDTEEEGKKLGGSVPRKKNSLKSQPPKEQEKVVWQDF